MVETIIALLNIMPGKLITIHFTRWLAFLMVFCFSTIIFGAPLPSMAAVTRGEVCRNDINLGTMRPEPYSDPWICINSTQTIFWWPPECTPGAMITAEAVATKTFVVSSKQQSPPLRNLAVWTSTGVDQLVGSPFVNDNFLARSGYHTYIIGGNGSSIGVQSNPGLPNDRVETMILSTLSESDSVKGSASATDYVYINSSSQWTGGSVIFSPGIPGAAGVVAKPFRGSKELFDSPPTGPGTCPVAWRFSSREASTPLLATIAPAKVAAFINNLPFSAWIHSLCALVKKPFRLALLPPLPGVATIQGLQIQPGDPDRIFVPADQYLFQGKPLAEFGTLPTLVVKGIRFGAPRVVSPEEQEKLIAQSPGLEKVRSDVAPLVYFQDEGVLVASQNGDPLGSTSNPGRVIARLLDRKGRPQVLPITPGQSLAQVSFLAFDPPQPKPDREISPSPRLSPNQAPTTQSRAL